MTSTRLRASGKRGPQPYLPSRRVALALLASAQLMLVLDVAVVNVALPDIGVALHLQRGGHFRHRGWNLPRTLPLEGLTVDQSWAGSPQSTQGYRLAGPRALLTRLCHTS